mmetsp:Transcript_13830/g.32818  ORF Transcript_13830/g.32818 Transcript_13830/m.32818 type:complete len:123 (+) Transcript_13830:202-570(+)
MEAAWSGSLALVRLLLAFGGDTEPTGHSHFSGGIKVNGPWLDAAGWADARGHAETAEHLRRWAQAPPEVRQRLAARARATAKAAAKAANPTPPSSYSPSSSSSSSASSSFGPSPLAQDFLAH